jgi:hypothetical protein
MRLPLRRIVLGFAVGASAGWVASLLRRPKDAPAGTGADAAEHMPVEEFGSPAEVTEGAEGTEGAEKIAQEPTAPAEVYGDVAVDPGESDGETAAESDEERPPPRKALPETVTPPPGTETTVGDGSAEPAKPTPRRRAAKATKGAKAAAEPVSEAVREAVREGRAQVDEHLAGLDESVVPPPAAAPEARRRRKRAD